MRIVYDPILDDLRQRDTPPELAADPANPAAQDAWIRKTVSGGSGGGKIGAVLGLGFPYLKTAGGSTSYQFSYRTTEGGTVRITLT